MSREKKKGSCFGTIMKVILILMIVGGIGVYSAGVYLGEIPDYGGVVDKVINIIPGQKATPEFMDMMNNYEAFIDEYIEFMEKYEASDDSESMLNDFNDYMAEYQKLMEKINEIDQSELSKGDLNYYNKVQMRVLKKLANMSDTYEETNESRGTMR